MGCQIARIGLFHKDNSFAEPMSLVLQLPVPHRSRTVAEVFLAEVLERNGMRSGDCRARSAASRRARQSARAKVLDLAPSMQEFCATARAPKFFLVHLYLDRCGVAEAARTSRDRERVRARRSYRCYRCYGERGCLGRPSVG